MDKPSIISKVKNIKIEQDKCNICIDIEKSKNIMKIIKKMEKKEINNIVLEKKLQENINFIKALNASSIKIFDGRWLEKYLTFEILDYIMIQASKKVEETEIAITVNEITDLSIEIILKLAKQYKRTTLVTNHINKLKKIEKELYEKNGILIAITNNQKKSLLKPEIILNIDFNQELLNKYKINENAIIVNLEGDIKIKNKRFNGININNYEINVGREEIIWREDMNLYNNKDLLEKVLYCRDTFKNIRKQIEKNKISIKELFGNNGKIERFY